jgi:hypothetical protein
MRKTVWGGGNGNELCGEGRMRGGGNGNDRTQNGNLPLTALISSRDSLSNHVIP